MEVCSFFWPPSFCHVIFFAREFYDVEEQVCVGFFRSSDAMQPGHKFFPSPEEGGGVAL
jgi:hypothetical protein